MQRTKKPEENKIKTRQQIKKGKSKRFCRQSTWLIIALLSHRYRYAVALLSLCCRTDIASLSFRCRSAAVSPLSRRCCTAIALLSLHCCSASVTPAVATQSLLILTPLLLRCRAVVAQLSHRYCSAIALLSLLSLRCRCC